MTCRLIIVSSSEQPDQQKEQDRSADTGADLSQHTLQAATDTKGAKHPATDDTAYNTENDTKQRMDHHFFASVQDVVSGPTDKTSKNE